jgi:hypothetical protein
MTSPDIDQTQKRWAVKGPRDFVSGILVIALAVLVLWALSRISSARYETISPALFPRLCAYALVISGLALAMRGLLRDGPSLDEWPFRGTALVLIATVLFGALTPVIGYLLAGALTVLVGGLASPEARLKELLALAIGLVVFSYALFTLGLKLSVPIFPTSIFGG